MTEATGVGPTDVVSPQDRLANSAAASPARPNDDIKPNDIGGPVRAEGEIAEEAPEVPDLRVSLGKSRSDNERFAYIV